MLKPDQKDIKGYNESSQRSEDIAINNNSSIYEEKKSGDSNNQQQQSFISDKLSTQSSFMERISSIFSIGAFGGGSTKQTQI